MGEKTLASCWDAQDADVSAYPLDHICRFIFDALNSYDQSESKSMGIADYFVPDIKWYGPGGIGACLSLREFEEFHQNPWLQAYPDRQVQNLDALTVRCLRRRPGPGRSQGDTLWQLSRCTGDPP